ncbi:MAG: hypothetical protein HDKAJFGB_00878 [Anaerolineae bacterium]|nr:hypothetical protein [Anaerolineae bacterium]
MTRALYGAVIALAGCGHLTHAERYAIAVGVGAVGTALVTTTSTCVDESTAACERLVWRSSLSVLGAGLTAGAGAYLMAERPAPASPPVPQSQPPL